MPLMAIEKPEKPEGPLWIAVVVVAVVFLLGIAALAGLGWLVYYAADLICVAADPASASAVCQDVRG